MTKFINKCNFQIDFSIDFQIDFSIGFLNWIWCCKITISDWFFDWFYKALPDWFCDWFLALINLRLKKPISIEFFQSRSLWEGKTHPKGMKTHQKGNTIERILSFIFIGFLTCGDFAQNQDREHMSSAQIDVAKRKLDTHDNHRKKHHTWTHIEKTHEHTTKRKHIQKAWKHTK